MNGMFMFLKYAQPPNLLGYCGPKSLSIERGSLLQFEGAVPYLRLIARANNIKDEFDERVVEAYWLGNDLLKNVSNKNLYRSVEERFRKKMGRKDWRWLMAESIPEAKPHHVFHVFDIYRRAGLLRSGAKDKILETINSCRIGWGRVVATELNTELNTEHFPLVFKGNKLQFGEKIIKKIISFDSSIKAGDEVSFHWNYVCDKITSQQKRNLIYWTQYHLDITNQTI
ncbi:hypothetical protein KKA27_02650 [Patescibacteria group bacterium]|nr:hypothetical protein [Patescibacteria group bacterium]